MVKISIIISLVVLFAVAASTEINLKPNIPKLDELEEIDINAIINSLDYASMLEKNVFEALLPLYGRVKLTKLINQKNIDEIKSVFEEKPELWETLRVEFAKCEVFLPTLEESNWTVDQEDMDRIIGIFGVDATIGDFFDDDYVKELEKCLDDHDTLIFLLEVIAKFGVIIGHDADFDEFADVASELLLDGPIILALLPTLIVMFIAALNPFPGRRDLNEITHITLKLVKYIPPSLIQKFVHLCQTVGTKSILQIALSIAKPLITNLIQGK